MFRDLGTLVARLVVGGSFLAHGGQKAFGWFGGPGPGGVAAGIYAANQRAGRTASGESHDGAEAAPS